MCGFPPDLLKVFWKGCLEVILVKLLEHAAVLCLWTGEEATPTAQGKSEQLRFSFTYLIGSHRINVSEILLKPIKGLYICSLSPSDPT